MIDSPFFREIKSPINATQLRPLDRRCTRVQFCGPLIEKDFEKLATFLVAYPRMELRMYGDFRRNCNLRFLKHFPFVRRLSSEAFNLSDFDGIDAVSDELESLLSLSIKLGGTSNVELLPKVGKLRFIKFWMVRGLADLTPIANVSTLQFLYLHALKNVETLPSLRPLHKLRRVNLIGMKGLAELNSVANAPNLEELVAIEMPNLEPHNFQPFVGHKKLKHALIEIGNRKKSEAAEELLNLPDCDLIGDGFEFTTTKSR